MEITVPLTVRDLTHADLESCGWSGTPLHLTYVAQALDRVGAREVDYLAVCQPSGLPVAIGGIDYVRRAGAGELWQLAVHPALQGCGIGTMLVAAGEQRIRDRGLELAEIGVEQDNPRARALYERLGYVAYDSELAGWDEEGPDGEVRRRETMCILMRKHLV